MGISALRECIIALEKRREANVLALQQRIETDILSMQKRIDLLEDRLYESKVELSDVELAFGCFDNVIECHDSKLKISGWLLLPEREFDEVALYINQSKAAESKVIVREDVAKVYPFITHAKYSGFSFSVSKPDKEIEGIIDICVVGLARGRKIAKMQTGYQDNIYAFFTAPPAHLMIREISTDDFSYYMRTGIQCYKEFWTVICKYVDPLSIRSMLDWGCGTGRNIHLYSKLSRIHRICGCDVDAEAIAWCLENIKSVEFSVVPLYPPTHYPCNEFDLIISYSVLTHLPCEAQICWLKEMQRILVPGGLFLATLNGEFALVHWLTGRKAKDALKGGFYDYQEDLALDGIVPKDYYRDVFQSKEYTLKEYSRYFEILEYIERGAVNFQDLIVMRKRN